MLNCNTICVNTNTDISEDDFPQKETNTVAVDSQASQPVGR